MKVSSIILTAAVLFLLPVAVPAAVYDVQKISDGVYAAIAKTTGGSNAIFVVSEGDVTVAGAHFTRDGIAELVSDIRAITSYPIHSFILTHHHRGYNYLDFDFPPGVEIITSGPTWQALSAEYRKFTNPVLFFETSLTLKPQGHTLVVTNTGYGHSEGDVVVYLPAEGILFTSDLVANEAVGFMGDGHMREWVLNLEMMEDLGPRIVVPGIGKPADSSVIVRYRTFIQDFLTEVIQHLEGGDSKEQARKSFFLPQHVNLPGYRTYFEVNFNRAWDQLKGLIPYKRSSPVDDRK